MLFEADLAAEAEEGSVVVTAGAEFANRNVFHLLSCLLDRTYVISYTYVKSQRQLVLEMKGRIDQSRR